jgi:protein gp37
VRPTWTQRIGEHGDIQNEVGIAEVGEWPQLVDVATALWEWQRGHPRHALEFHWRCGEHAPARRSNLNAAPGLVADVEQQCLADHCAAQMDLAAPAALISGVCGQCSDQSRSDASFGALFRNSMSDLFHESVPVPFIQEVWHVMQETPRHTYQILTKRPERTLEVSRDLPLLPNVWLGTSVEDDRVLHRIDALRQVAAAIRFISFEPLIGSVARANLSGIHWVIVGGESGPRARPMNPEWVNEIEAMCRNAGIAFFFKQWGGTNKKRTGRLFRGETVDEMPAATA